MRIKRFEASTMGEALSMVKREFGPEAVILSAKTGSAAGGVLGVLRKPTAVVTAAIDSDGASVDQAEEISPVQADSRHPAARKSGNPEKKRLLNSSGNNGNSGAGSSGLRVFENLLAQGVDKDVAERVCSLAIEEGLRGSAEGAGAEWQSLAAVLERAGMRTCKVAREGEGPLVIAMVGPWGSGKTTITAKVAARHALDLGEKVAVVSMDNQKIAGQEELKGYAGILDIPFRFVADGQDLPAVIEEYKDLDLLLVDTPGFASGPRAEQRDAFDLKSLVSHARPFLVLDATVKSEDLIAVLNRPAGRAAKGVVFTRMDQTCGFGSVLSFLVASRLPAAYWSHGRRIPRDLSYATPESLARLLSGHGMETMADEGEPVNGKEPFRREESRTKVKKQGYMGNRSSDTYHRHDCLLARRIGEKNRLMFARRVDAVAMGYSPCGVCRPDSVRENYKSRELSAGKGKRRMVG
jgi:flagellar biosynthesis protein FlhF